MVAYLDWPDMYGYYRALLPKYYKMGPSLYPPHVTCIRGYAKEGNLVEPIDAAKKGAFWRKYEGELVDFQYDPVLKSDERFIYFWLNMWSERIGDIREELGLARIHPRFDCYHATVGNAK